MKIEIENYRVRRYDSLNICVEIYKPIGKCKNPYGRNGKPSDGEIAQKNESNKAKYKWSLIGYYNTLSYALRQLVEHCLTNNENLNSIETLQHKVAQLHEKINEISAMDDRLIERNILSSTEEFSTHEESEEEEVYI